MFILSILFIIFSTLILLFVIPILIDRKIEQQEKIVSERITNFNQIRNKIEDAGPSRTMFTILQNQLKIFQRTKDDSNEYNTNNLEMFKDLESLKKQVSTSALNILQSTEFINQKQYEDYSFKINSPFNYNDYLGSFNKLHNINQEIDKSLTDGIFHFKSLKDEDENKLSKLKKAKSYLVILGVIINIIGISIGAYSTQIENEESRKEIKSLFIESTNELKNDINIERKFNDSIYSILIEDIEIIKDSISSPVNKK